MTKEDNIAFLIEEAIIEWLDVPGDLCNDITDDAIRATLVHRIMHKIRKEL